MDPYTRKEDDTETEEEGAAPPHNFWKPMPESPGFPITWKTVFTAVLCLIIGLLGAFAVDFLDNNPLSAGIILTFLLVTLVITNGAAPLQHSLQQRFLHRRHYSETTLLEDFETISYYLTETEDVLLIEDRQNITGLGLLRVKGIPIRFQGSFERLVRDLYKKRGSMCWFLTHAPANIHWFVGNYNMLVDEKREWFLQLSRGELKAVEDAHGGLWGARLLLGVHSDLPTSISNEPACHALSLEVLKQLENLRRSISIAYPDIMLEQLKGEELVAAHQNMVSGCRSNSFFVKGKESAKLLVQIPQSAIKSMDYHPPAEFTSRTGIKYDFELGYIYETESESTEQGIGLKLTELQNGVLTVGGTTPERFRTNLKIMYEAIMREENCLIITTNPEWRRLLDLFETANVFRLGSDLTFNPMDSEGNPIYKDIFAEVLAQLAHLSSSGFKHLQNLINKCYQDTRDIPTLDILKDKLRTLLNEARNYNTRELESVFQFLENIEMGELLPVIGKNLLPFETLLNRITILELNVEGYLDAQFLILCVLAKALAYLRIHPHHRGFILVDSAGYLAPLDQQVYKMPYLLNWIKLFKRSPMGLCLNFKFPSELPFELLKQFETILAHRITHFEDLKVTDDLLLFLPEYMVHSHRRKTNYQREYLKRIHPHKLILKTGSILDPTTIWRKDVDVSGTQIWTPDALQDRLLQAFPDWKKPEPTQRSLIERDFGEQTPIVTDIFSLLMDYERLTRRDLLSALNSEPNYDLDMQDLDRILLKLVQENYLVRNVWEDVTHYKHYSYQMTGKGTELYEAYLEQMGAALRVLQGGS